MPINFSSDAQTTGQKKRRIHWGILSSFFILFLLLVGAYGFRSYARITETRPALEVPAQKDIKPTSALGIEFPSPVKTEGFTDGIRLNPETEVSFEWQNENKKLLVKPVSFWKTNTKYSLSLPKGRTIWWGNIPEIFLSFETWVPPSVVSVFPENGAKEVLLGTEDPVVVKLNRSATDSFFDFSFNGEEAAMYEIDSDKQEFRILPKNIEQGKTYSLVVRTRHRDAGDDSFEKSYEGSFETLPPAPTEWAKDFPTRLEQARKYTKPFIKTGKYIDISLANQVMVTFENGKALDAYMISSGKRGMDTPKGSHAIRNKSPRVWSKAYGLYMPYWMALVPDGKFGIHELPEWPGGYKEGANHLGTPVSHGCVRLGVGSAETVYTWADIGTPVLVY